MKAQNMLILNLNQIWDDLPILHKKEIRYISQFVHLLESLTLKCSIVYMLANKFILFFSLDGIRSV